MQIHDLKWLLCSASVVALLSFTATPAHAQIWVGVHQRGPITPGNVATWAANNILVDGGTAPASTTPGSRQILSTVGSATYTTPPLAKQLRIRMVGGGGGGGGSGGATATTGGVAGSSSFNAIVANPGGPGQSNGLPGEGGTGGAGGAPPLVFRSKGSAGMSAIVSDTGGGGTFARNYAGVGPFGGGNSDTAAAANSGAGGGGGPGSPGVIVQCGAGGGSGEYVEIIINAPAASYPYTIGAGGIAGAAGTGPGAAPGQAGGSGLILVDEYY